MKRAPTLAPVFCYPSVPLRDKSDAIVLIWYKAYLAHDFLCQPRPKLLIQRLFLHI
jgi:hypothetical protein